jgi:SAM-dependent methyltransferase
MILPDVGSHYTLKQSPYSSHMILMRLLDPSRLGQRLLDVGCGNGFLARLLAQKGFQVTGLEHPQGYDANFPPEVALIVHDLEQPLPGMAGDYDVVLAADVLEHLKTPAALLAGMRGLLRPGGCVVASLPNSGNIYFRLNILFGLFPQEDKGLFDRTHLHFFMWQNWKDLFSECGLDLEVYDVSGIPLGLAFAKFSESWPVRMGEWVCYHLARIWKTLFAYQFLVVAKPKL